MNVSRSHDGFFIFDRSKKFIFKKKLEGFTHLENGMLLRSNIFKQNPIVMENQCWCSIDFLIETALISTRIRLISVQNLLTFV